MTPLNHGPWAYPPRPRKKNGLLPVVLIAAAAVTVALVLGHVATTALADLAYHNVHNICGAC